MNEHGCLPANFLWNIGMRFLSWECWDFWKWHDHFRIFPKKSEVFRRSPKSSEDVRLWRKWKQPSHFPSPSLRTRINASSLRVLFTSKIREGEKGICHLFTLHMVFVPYMGLSSHNFGNCVKQDDNNSHFSIRHEKLACKREPAWDRSFQPAGVRLTLKTWELAGTCICLHNYMYM